MRVAVVQPPLLLAEDFIDYPWFASLGALHTAGSARAAGHDVVLLDAFSAYGASVYPYDGGVRHWGVPVPRLLAPLEDAPVDVVFVHHPPFLHLDGENAELRRLLGALRAVSPGAHIVLDDAYLGAMHYLAYDRVAVLERYPEVDYALQWETDRLVPELLAALAEGRAPARDAPAAARILRQREEPGLDGLAAPAWDLVPAADYGRFLRAAFDRTRRPNPFRVAADTRPLVTSRGCVYRCSFCTTNPHAGPGEAHRFRALGPAALRVQLRALREVQGAHHLAVLDQVANLNPAFSEVLELFRSEGFAYDFPNGMRADLLTDEHLARMAGHVGTLSVSAESGSQRVVDDVIGKRLDLAHVERVARQAEARGIPLVVHWMVGLPGERRDEVLRTFERALELYERFGAEPLLGFATPLPGTRLAEEVRALGGEDAGTRGEWSRDRPAGELLTEAVRAFRRRVRSAATRKVVVNLTYRCNNHCGFCAVGNPEGGEETPTARVGFSAIPREDAAFDELARVLDEYFAAGIRLVDFDGGEPLLHPRHLAVIRHARHRGYERVTLTTNGRVLAYEGAVCDLLAAGLHALRVSLHGSSAPVHERETRAPGSFAQTLSGLGNVRRLMPKGFDLGVNTTVTAGNLDDLPALGALLVSLGVPAWTLQLVTPFGRATADVVPAPERLRAVLPGVLARYHEQLRPTVVNAPPCLLPGYERFVVGDVAKAERRMVFVTKEHVNLASYLALRRVHGPACAECLFRPACAGEYRFEASP